MKPPRRQSRRLFASLAVASAAALCLGVLTHAAPGGTPPSPPPDSPALGTLCDPGRIEGGYPAVEVPTYDYGPDGWVRFHLQLSATPHFVNWLRTYSYNTDCSFAAGTTTETTTNQFESGTDLTIEAFPVSGGYQFHVIDAATNLPTTVSDGLALSNAPLSAPDAQITFGWFDWNTSNFSAVVTPLVPVRGEPAISGASDLLAYQSSGYRYEVIGPGSTAPAGFQNASFDDSGWSTGTAAFGQSAGLCPIQSTVATLWPINTQLLVRKRVSIPAGTTGVVVKAAVDNDVVAIYFNGTMVSGPISHDGCPNLDDVSIPIPDEILQAGDNLVAFQVLDRGGESFFDMRVVGAAPLCPPPTITTQPVSVIGQVGDTVTLSVAATAATDLSYQWLAVDGSGSASPIPNATGVSYTTSGFAGTASFKVRVFSACGASVDSAEVSVTLVPSPKGRGYSLKITQPKSSAVVGSPYDIQVIAMNGTSALSGAPVTLTVSGANSTSLTLVTGASGDLTFTYTGFTAGLDTLTASSPIVPRDLVSNTATLSWVPPPPALVTLPPFDPAPAQKTKGFEFSVGIVEEGLVGVFANEVSNAKSDDIPAAVGENDSCYEPAVAAAHNGALLALETSVELDVVNLATQIVLDFSTGSDVGDAILQVAQFWFDVATSDNPTQTALNDLITNGISYLVDLDQLGKVASIAAGDLTGAAVDKITSTLFSDIKSASFTGIDKAGTTTVKVTFMYSPETHNVASVVKAACSDGTSRTYSVVSQLNSGHIPIGDSVVSVIR